MRISQRDQRRRGSDGEKKKNRRKKERRETGGRRVEKEDGWGEEWEVQRYDSGHER